MKNYIKYYVYLFALFSVIIGAEMKTMYNNFESSKINLLYSDIHSTSLSLELSDFDLYEIEGHEGKFKINLEQGTPILEYGMPDLPKISTSIIIPDDRNMSILVESAEYEEYQNIHIAPSKGNITRDVDPDSIPFSYSDVYKTDAFYPGNLAENGQTYIVRDLRGQRVVFYPIQYNPVQKVLRVYKNIEVKVFSTDVNNTNALKRKNNSEHGIKLSNEFANIYQNLFINYNTDTRFEYLAEQGNMLIISYDDFIDEMQPFVDWKNKKGVPTEIVSLNEIGNSTSQIQNFINQYYYEYGLTFLLLVGDINQMPTHIVNGAASDPTYGFIEGGDSFAEVIVGRFSANNPSQLNTQIQRTLEYEQNPDENGDWYSSALGIGSNQGPGYGGLSDDEFNDLLWNDLLSEFTYSQFQGIYDPSGSTIDGINAVNQGVGLINYTGHAGPTGWGNGAPLNVNDVQNLENTGKLPFIFTVGCNPGEFNNYGECFCESWMWATDSDGNPVGSVAHLGSTISQSWEPPMHGQWAMNAILTELYDNNITRTYGGIIANGCMHMNEAQGSYGINETNHWTIFGDPSLMIRTESPSIINAIYDEVITVGQEQFIVDVGTDGILVALSSNGTLLSSAYSNGGIAILDLTNVSTNPGTIDMMITGFNAIPFEDSINIITPDGAYLVYNGYGLTNNNIYDVIQYGQSVEIDLFVENVGTMNTNGINVNVSTDDEYISMINGESIIAYAIVGSLAQTESPISFEVSNNVPDGHMAQFSVVLENEETWAFNFNIEISAPVFEILNPVISDENGDNVWNPGEIATIDVELSNSGSAGFGYYPGAVISTDNPYVEILSGENDNTFYGIDSNTIYDGQFVVLSDESTPMGTIVEFEISWGYSLTAPCDNDYFVGEGCVEQANLTFNAIIGHPSVLVWDPSDNHISGNKLIQYFNDINFNGYDYITTQNVPDTENYTTAFIFLGVYPENYTLGEGDVAGFIDMLDNGYNVYMEGGDTWAFDFQTALQPLFGLTGVSDGTSDLSAVIGSNDTFADGLYMTYSGGNSYIDQLAPAGGTAFSLLENEQIGYITAVAYENMSIGYKTIGSSHELGGLEGNDFNVYISGILDFFETGAGNLDPIDCIVGDLNEDNSLDVTDIIRLVNIIINIGLPANDVEECASDVNVDGEINILDVLVMINLILDDSSRGGRVEIASDISLHIFDNELVLNSIEPIKGLEFIVNSNDSELEFNNNLNMDISYNVIDNKHYVLIYSFDGEYIQGRTPIFVTNESFSIEEFYAANSINKFVEVNFDESSNIPYNFVLKQNYPNPFNPITTIEVELGQSDFIDLSIYNISGQKVATIAEGYYLVGNHSFSWNSTDDIGVSIPSGVYIYTLKGTEKIVSKTMTLLK